MNEQVFGIWCHKGFVQASLNLTFFLHKRKEFPERHFSELESCLRVGEKPNLIGKVTFLENKYFCVNKPSCILQAPVNCYGLATRPPEIRGAHRRDQLTKRGFYFTN